MLMNTDRNYRWHQGQWVRAERADWPVGRQRIPQAVYWRRRLVALLIAMTVLSLISWAFFGALGLSASPPGARPGHRATSHRGAAPGGSGPGGAGQSGSGSSDSQSPTSGSSQSPTSRNNQSPTSSPAVPDPGGRPVAVSSGPRPCSPGDVVLSLLVSQPAYASPRLPQFSVDVVSTGSPTCTFNVGARYVALVIRFGSARVWGSADCPRGSGSLVVDLQRGVPATLPITWNRHTSSPGCTRPSRGMPAGLYSATVTDDRVDSNSVTFRLVR